MLKSIPTKAPSIITVDCSMAVSSNTEKLLDWVRSESERSSIHVVLPSSKNTVQHNLQRILLSLGCRITKRNAYAAS